MLVLTRSMNEQVVLLDESETEVLAVFTHIRPNVKIRVLVSAPRHVKIRRLELIKDEGLLAQVESLTKKGGGRGGE